MPPDATHHQTAPWDFLYELVSQPTIAEADRARAQHSLELLRSAFATHDHERAQFAAIMASARSLAKATDFDGALRHVVQRAHELLGAEVTYLSEYLPNSGELRVRHTIGSTSSLLPDLHVPSGAGLASLVAQTRSAQYVEDYRLMEAATHTETLDDAIHAEGIVSLLGVPLVSDDLVIGVLFCGARRRRVFTAQDTALLSTLADHASIAIMRGRTLSSLTQAAEDARAAATSLENHLKEREKASAIHQEMIAIVLQGGDEASVVRALSQDLGRRVWLQTPSDGVIADSGDTPETLPDLSTRAKQAANQAARTGRFARVSSGAIEGVAQFDAGNNVPLLLVVARSGPHLTAVETRTVERGIQVCALVGLRRRASQSEEFQADDTLIEALVSGRPLTPSQHRRLAAHHLRPSAIPAVLVGHLPQGFELQRSQWTRAMAGRGLVGRHQDSVVIIANSLDKVTGDTSAPWCHTQLVHHGLPGEPFPDRWTSCYRLLEVAELVHPNSTFIDTDELLPFAVMLSGNADTTKRFIRLTLGAVLDQPGHRAKELTSTMLAWIDAGSSLSQAAKTLMFHPNTVRQRLARVDALIGPTWRSGERRFLVETALRAHASGVLG